MLTPAPDRLLAQSSVSATDLGRGPTVVRLSPACAADGRAVSLARRIAAASPRRRFLLTIGDLRAQVQPGVLFDLRLANASEHGEQAAGVLLGTLNFYAAQRPGVTARPRKVSYDVTEALRALMTSGGLDGGFVLVVQPVAAPAPGSAATIGRIALVEQ